MKTKQGLSLRKVGPMYMLVDREAEAPAKTNVYTLNATTAFLWEKIGEQDFDESMLVEWLCEHYDAEPADVVEDVRNLIKEWKSMGLVR